MKLKLDLAPIRPFGLIVILSPLRSLSYAPVFLHTSLVLEYKIT